MPVQFGGQRNNEILNPCQGQIMEDCHYVQNKSTSYMVLRPIRFTLSCTLIMVGFGASTQFQFFVIQCVSLLSVHIEIITVTCHDLLCLYVLS